MKQKTKSLKKSGRKPIADKKELIRLYILQSVIDANGGVENCQERCTALLNNNSVECKS